jgi:hypothetical protein
MTTRTAAAIGAPTDLLREAEALCDACGKIVDMDPADGGARSAPGHGVYLWARGDEIRFETVPLCASCATAIGLAALGRCEIEEEEG